MSNYRRPWWLLVNKSSRLSTTVREESGPGERIFIVRGEPLVQGLAWLTCGPAAALLIILILTGLAINLNVQEQGGAMSFVFVAAFLVVPAIVWGIATVAANQLSVKYITVEREAEARACQIRMNFENRELFYQTDDADQEVKLLFRQVQQVKVTPAIGARDRNSMRLVLHTGQGQVVLLDEGLGTQTQKIDLAREIQEMLDNYSG